LECFTGMCPQTACRSFEKLRSVADQERDRADAGSCKSPPPAGRGRAGQRRPSASAGAARVGASPRAAAAPAGGARHRLGRVRGRQPGGDAAAVVVADGAVPGHLGEPDGDLRVPAVAAAADDPDLGGGDAGHRRHHLRAGAQGPAGRRLPGRGAADRADVPGHGLAWPQAAGRHPGAADRDGTGAADLPGERAPARAAAPVPPGRPRTSWAPRSPSRSATPSSSSRRSPTRTWPPTPGWSPANWRGCAG